MKYINPHSTKHTADYKKQGDGRDSWAVSEFNDSDVLMEKYMVYENPNTPTEVEVLTGEIDLLKEEIAFIKEELKKKKDK